MSFSMIIFHARVRTEKTVVEQSFGFLFQVQFSNSMMSSLVKKQKHRQTCQTTNEKKQLYMNRKMCVIAPTHTQLFDRR